MRFKRFDKEPVDTFLAAIKTIYPKCFWRPDTLSLETVGHSASGPPHPEGAIRLVVVQKVCNNSSYYQTNQRIIYPIPL